MARGSSSSTDFLRDSLAVEFNHKEWVRLTGILVSQCNRGLNIEHKLHL
jgi:hypothetical protein